MKQRGKKKKELKEMRTSLETPGAGLVTKLCLTLVTPWTIACQTPLSLRFPRQEYWSELPFPFPGDLPNPGNKTCVSHVSYIGGQILNH